jgi:hypothetical protein
MNNKAKNNKAKNNETGKRISAKNPREKNEKVIRVAKLIALAIVSWLAVISLGMVLTEGKGFLNLYADFYEAWRVAMVLCIIAATAGTVMFWKKGEKLKDHKHIEKEEMHKGHKYIGVLISLSIPTVATIVAEHEGVWKLYRDFYMECPVRFIITNIVGAMLSFCIIICDYEKVMNDNVRELTNEIAELEEGKNKVKAANDREIRVANATQAGNDYNRDMQKENNAEHIKALEKENDTLKNKNDALVKACNNKDDQVNALNRELSKARNSLQAAKVRCNGYEQEKKSKKQPTEKDA